MQARPRKLPLLATMLLLAVGATSHAREPIAIGDFARLPELQSVSMSIDGKNLVALVPVPGAAVDSPDTALAVWDLDNPDKGPTLTPSNDRMKFVAASAMKADRVFALARQEWSGNIGSCGGEGRSSGLTKTFIFKGYLTDTSLKEFNEAFASRVRRVGVTEQVQRCMEIMGSASLVNTLPLDPDNVVISQIDTATLRGNYYLYNLRTNATTPLNDVKDGTSPALFNPRNGDVLVRTKLEPIGSGEYEIRVLLRHPDTGEFEQHDALTNKLSERNTVAIVGIDEPTGNFYVLHDIGSDRVQAWTYDPRKKQFDKEPLVAHPRYDIADLIQGTRRSNFNRIIGFTVAGPQMETTWVDPQIQAIQTSLDKAYPGQTVTLRSYTDDFSRVLFMTESASHPPAYHLLRDKKQVLTLGSERPWIKPELIGEQRWVTYKARDGMEIPAVLDLPAGWKQGDPPLPAIVHPHGGPWARDFTGWDGSGWVPFLTSRGYAVLRPNYRGSAGLGRTLWLAGDAEWGQKMQDDKDDGAAWLVEQGIAAKDRIAIFGYSYGGFAAAAAVVRPNGPYQCAISGAPVTDLTKLGWSWSENRLQRILQGRTVKGMDPMKNTDKASIPLLTYVGDRDVRTPAFHARSFYDAVKGKVPARFELIPDMPHSMPWYPRHQTVTLGLIEDFLAKDCKPGGL